MDMNQQYNSQRPPSGSGKRFWHIWGPFLINWGIGTLAGIVALSAFMTVYLATHSTDLLSYYQDQEAAMKLVEKTMEILMRYTTEIQGATAFITIPIMSFLYYRDRKREKITGVVPNKKAAALQYLPMLFMAGLLNIAMNNLIMIGNLSSYSAEYRETSEAFYSASLGMQILCLGVLVPVAEELVFRGLMYRRLREDTGFTASVIYSAVVFGLFHGNMVQMLYGTAMGLMLAYVCEKYGTVAAPIAAHITVNLVSILATYFHVYNRIQENILIVGAVTVACAAGAAGMFLSVQRIDEKPEVSDKNEGSFGESKS